MSGVRVNGLTFLALIAMAIGIVVAYRLGAQHGRRASHGGEAPRDGAPQAASGPAAPALEAERASPAPLEPPQLSAFAEDRRRLFAELADARAETARYRQIVVDIERNAPPPLLDAPGTPDDLKLIVGVGPVIERMLYQMGIGTYRQIARWSERDIDEIDARLPEFPGRIRRDGWVNQARTLHVSKYGTNP
jgi:predicted flap endonuclease-1-like 5' DNA nuclease